MDFFCRFDNLTTTIAWGRPELYTLTMWYTELSELHDLSEYEVYLAGGFAEYLNNPTNPKTWDADICLVCDNPNLPKLKEILDDGIRLAFKNRILIDLKCVNWYFWNTFRELSSGVIPEIDNTKITLIKNYLKFQKYIDGVLEIDAITTKHSLYKTNQEMVILSKGLYQIKGAPTILIEKVINKFNEGIYKGVYVDLKQDNEFIT
tara:strand:- start:1550 stop:2164 length:615 start_codon:yes stop_codon:yes gene_type:complete